MADEKFSIKKVHVTALQRFKNQNTLLKKFGENGLRLYKLLDSKKSKSNIIEELGISSEELDKILAFMEENAMIEIKEEKKPTKEIEEKVEEEIIEKEENKELEITFEENDAEELNGDFSEDITPIDEENKETELDEISPDNIEEKEDETKIEEDEEITFESANNDKSDVEIEPIDEFDEMSEENEESNENLEEEKPETEDEEVLPYEEDETEEVVEESSEDPSMEKMIRDKYGAIGIAVYTLIDGEKSAEEIMAETGLTETKLVEILDFMEEKGIIKLEYPDKKKSTTKPSGSFIKEEKKTSSTYDESQFNPLIDDNEIQRTPKGMETIDVPVKLPLDIVKSVQLKAKIMFEFGEKGSSVLESIDGKNDVLQIVLKSKSSLQFTLKMVDFLLNNNAVMLKPLTRDQIKEKYGLEAHRVYKKFGREGVLLYELIGKDMSIKQMMNKITPDKHEFVEMFVFVHNVLGVPIPVEKDILLKRLE